MALRYHFIDGRAMPMQNGLPPRYDEAVFKGSDSSHFKAPFASIVNQEYNNVYFSINKTCITWIKPESIICEYDYPEGIFTRIVLFQPVHERIKGAGFINLKKDQFSILAGSSWKGEMIPMKPGKHCFYHISWSSQFMHDIIKDEPELLEAINFSLYGFPYRFVNAPNYLDSTMKQVLYEITEMNFASKKNMPVLSEHLKKLCRLIVNHRKHFDPVKREMNEKDWHLSHSAKKLIDENLHTQFTTREISINIGMNEYKLKKLFPRITGFTLEEYRKYKLCVKVGRQIIEQPDEPLKNFYAEAGFSNHPNFSRGFLRHCGCKPTQLRSKEWDVNGISNDLNDEA